MPNTSLSNAFEDCLQRLADGQSLDTCLKAYPQYTPHLAVMLKTGLLIRHIQPSTSEIAVSRQRVLKRLEAYQLQRQQQHRVIRWTDLGMVATLLITMIMIMGVSITTKVLYLSHATNDPTPTMTATRTPTLTLTITVTTSLTIQSTQTLTLIPKSTVTPTLPVIRRTANAPTNLPTGIHITWTDTPEVPSIEPTTTSPDAPTNVP